MILTKGMHIKCRIHGKSITDAKIQIEKSIFFICQNVQDGHECLDKLGYKYSWYIGCGTFEDLEYNGVRDIELYDSKLPGNKISKKIITKKKKGTSKQYLITENIYTKLFNDTMEHDGGEATPYLLGMDKNYIIREALLMERQGGCYAMPDIDSKDLSKKMIRILKKNLIPCGLARVGDFGGGHDERGTIISQLRDLNPESILLSFSSETERMTIESVGITRVRRLKLFVIPDKILKRKEVAKNV